MFTSLSGIVCSANLLKMGIRRSGEGGSLYRSLGVSPRKEGVRELVRRLGSSAIPHAFVRTVSVAGEEGRVHALHVDTAGTKPIVTWWAWQEVEDTEVWRWLAEDALVMNLDDLMCAGFRGPFVFCVLFSRDAKLVSDAMLLWLTEGILRLCESLGRWGIQLVHAGGETADVGDLVSPIDVGVAMWSSAVEGEVVSCRPRAGDIVVGIASDGEVGYDQRWNSGIGSNGLTLARTVLLHSEYGREGVLRLRNLPRGRWRLSDVYEGKPLYQWLLSPTRTYAPFLGALWQEGLPVHGVVHCTGGGQTKVLHFLDKGLVVRKHSPFPVPAIFRLIQREGRVSWREMYEVFNMGWRLEVYLSERYVERVLDLARSFGLEARVVGEVVDRVGEPPAVWICSPEGEWLEYRLEEG